VPSRQDRMSALDQKMAAPDFWSNPDSAKEVVTEVKSLKALLGPFGDLQRRMEDLVVLHELAEEADSADDLAEAETEARLIAGDLERLEVQTLLAGPHDSGS